MNKISIIIQREYLSRVKKKSFLLTTLLVPLFFIAMYVGMIFLTKKSYEDTHANIYIYDHSGSVEQSLTSGRNITYIHSPDKKLEEQIPYIQDLKGNHSILIIPSDFFSSKQSELLSSGKPNMAIQAEVKRNLGQILLESEYKELGLDPEIIKNIDTNVKLSAKEISEDGDTKDSYTEVVMGLGMALSILIYITLVIYGSQVMRGVIEEKTSRIVEVIISSVKPFQLMMGKIIGIGLVGLTQFAMWIVLTLILVALATGAFFNPSDINQELLQNGVNQDTMPSAMGMDIKSIFDAINFPLLLISFVLFFLGGYLLYSAIFAAIGSAVDNETEASQFTMPITMPLLITYVLSFGVLINDPDGNIAVWLSMIPLTSPIAMLVRIPFGVPIWQIGVSLILLILGFIFVTWLAAKIYRVGILMYGKKASVKELIKWLKFKN